MAQSPLEKMARTPICSGDVFGRTRILLHSCQWAYSGTLLGQHVRPPLNWHARSRHPISRHLGCFGAPEGVIRCHGECDVTQPARGGFGVTDRMPLWQPCGPRTWPRCHGNCRRHDNLWGRTSSRRNESINRLPTLSRQRYVIVVTWSRGHVVTARLFTAAIYGSDSVAFKVAVRQNSLGSTFINKLREN